MGEELKAENDLYRIQLNLQGGFLLAECNDLIGNCVRTLGLTHLFPVAENVNSLLSSKDGGVFYSTPW